MRAHPSYYVEEVATEGLGFLQLIKKWAKEGKGYNIMVMSDHRCPPHEGVADGTSFDGILLTGLPLGGHRMDEFKRWACYDPRPVIYDKRTNAPLTPERFEELFDKYLLRSHEFHEFTRFLEGEVQRHCLPLEMRDFWYLYLNSKPGCLDGMRFPGTTHLGVAVTKDPLQDLYDREDGIYRVKPQWAGMADPTQSLRLLSEKVRDGFKDEAIARPQAKAIKERCLLEDLPEEEALLESIRLVCISSEGHVNTKRKDANVNEYYKIMHYADGTVAAESGKILDDGSDRPMQYQCIQDAGMPNGHVRYEAAIADKIKQGYHKRALQPDELPIDDDDQDDDE